jgi:hypothetical protein
MTLLMTIVKMKWLNEFKWKFELIFLHTNFDIFLTFYIIFKQICWSVNFSHFNTYCICSILFIVCISRIYFVEPQWNNTNGRLWQTRGFNLRNNCAHTLAASGARALESNACWVYGRFGVVEAAIPDAGRTISLCRVVEPWHFQEGVQNVFL